MKSASRPALTVPLITRKSMRARLQDLTRDLASTISASRGYRRIRHISAVLQPRGCEWVNSRLWGPVRSVVDRFAKGAERQRIDVRSDAESGPKRGIGG